jgi:transcription elongation factor Elf1
MEALKNIFSFLFGSSSNKPVNQLAPEDDRHQVHVDNIQQILTKNEPTCPKCNQHMKIIHISTNDFINMSIYSCPDCHTISEYQFDKNDQLVKEINIYNPIVVDEVIHAERLGYVKIENFSLGKLWSVCGELCYPANIKADFPETNTAAKIFIKVKSHGDAIEGYAISNQFLIGEIKLSEKQVHSMFFNPYLSKLPKPEFSYVGIPSANCDMLEAVFPIRFNHDIQVVDDQTSIHRLSIIQDKIIQCNGLELYIRYLAHGVPSEESSIHIFEHIGLKSIIMNNDVETSEGYAIQLHTLTRHTLSAKTRSNISDNERKSFYDAIIEFFTMYDKTNG